MAVFEITKKQFVFVVSMSLLCLIYCGPSKPGQQCLWLNDTNSLCDICNIACEGETLNCSNRNLENVAFNLSDQTLGLNASYSQLSESPAILDCPKLEWIDLSYNRKLKVVNKNTLKNMNCTSLKIVNMDHCGILQVAPQPVESFLPNLMILLIASNSLTIFDAAPLQKLENFKVLDIRGNPIDQKIFCELMKQNISVLIDDPSNHSVSPYAQIGNSCQSYDLTYQLSFFQEIAHVINLRTSVCYVENAVTETAGGITSYGTSAVATGSSIHANGHTIITEVSTEAGKETEEQSWGTIFVLISSASCTVFVALVFLISYRIRKWWKRKRRQNQYNRWLAVYTPPECVFTYQKRVSFSGEIVIKDGGESITKKKQSSDKLKKHRQFDVSLLIRTQSLPPQLREEENERPIRVISWI